MMNAVTLFLIPTLSGSRLVEPHHAVPKPRDGDDKASPSRRERLHWPKGPQCDPQCGAGITIPIKRLDKVIN
jgi:hypothetical protein